MSAPTETATHNPYGLTSNRWIAEDLRKNIVPNSVMVREANLANWSRALPENNWQEDFPHENGNYCHTCPHCLLPFLGHKRRFSCRACCEKATSSKDIQPPTRFNSHPFTPYIGPYGSFDGDDQPEPSPPPMFPQDCFAADDDRLTPRPGFQPITCAPPRVPEDNDHPHWQALAPAPYDLGALIKDSVARCATNAQPKENQEPLVCSRCGEPPAFTEGARTYADHLAEYGLEAEPIERHPLLHLLARQPATLPNPEAAVQARPEQAPKSGASLSIELAKGKLEIKSAALSATIHF